MLKQTILALTLLATPLAAETEVDRCKLIGGIAAQIMESRQLGIPLSDTMNIVNDIDILKTMTITAYQSPRFSSDSYRQEAIKDFRNEVEVMCYNTAD